MSPKAKPAAGKKGTEPTSTAFIEVVRQALEQFHYPTWLGEHSPLAAPYFLGDRLPTPGVTATDDARQRGQAVQQLLLEVTETLVEKYKRWNQGQVWHELLHVSYFRPKRLLVYQLIQDLHTSEAAYHRNHPQAIAHLAAAVIDRVKPALRLESVTAPASLVGRAAEMAQLLAALQAGQSVGLSGPGGVGKTTLGQALAHHFAPQTTFWYTFSPGLNDGLRSLLFALAWFLHKQGASTLWSQFIADRGEIKPGQEGVALNLLRHDLASLGERQVLLCFDEVDLLQPNEYEAHTQLIPLLESLRGQVPLLYIGQKSLLASDLPYTLTGLTLADSALLLQQAGLDLARSDLNRLYADTQGNPRLLELFIALAHSLQRSGETPAAAIASALTDFTQTPALEFLLRRIWLHLNPSEKYLLELLAVFRNPVPRLAWNQAAQQQEAITQLQHWRLVQVDEQDNIQLLPALRTAIYENLLADAEKTTLHLEAALVRAQYGQFAAAAHHYAAGGESILAINLLYTYKEQMIDQGQAEAALTVLLAISHHELPKESQEKLFLLRAELQKLLGHYDPARQTLQSIYWSIPFLSAQRWRLEGDIAELRGEVSQAQNAYQAGLDMVEKLLGEVAYFHRDLGYLYMNDVEFERAEHEVLRIRYEAANLEGAICEMRGDLPRAAAAYQLAFELAQTAHYAYGVANTHSNLAGIYLWQRQLVAAEGHLHLAIDFFRTTGRLNKLASATYNLGLARRLAKEYAAAITPAEEALAWFSQLGESYGQAVANELLAEIHLGLGNLAQAEAYAQRVIAQEHTSCMPDGLRTLGEIRLQQGQLIAAEQLLNESLRIAQANQDRILEAYALRARCTLQIATADLSAAQASLAQAMQIFGEAGLTAEVEECAEIATRLVQFVVVDNG